MNLGETIDIKRAKYMSLKQHIETKYMFHNNTFNVLYEDIPDTLSYSY